MAHGVVKNTMYGGLVIGSTTHKVIHLTDRPVLIVR
jgi:nucleotide-binding universal stress UspA family protein